MKAVGRYDANLQMFVEEAQDLDLRRLTFLRWLVEHDRLEHPVSGPSTGDFVLPAVEVVPTALPLAS